MTDEKKTVKAAFVTREELINAVEGGYTSAAAIARMAAEVFRLKAKLKHVTAASARPQPSDFAATFYEREHANGQAVLDEAGVGSSWETLPYRIAHVIGQLETARSARDEAERRATDVNQQAREFRAAMGQSVGTHPRVPDDETVRFCARLVAEEFCEMLEATLDDREVLKVVRSAIGKVVDSAPIRVDLPELADACGDIDYVVAGLRCAFGIDGGPIAKLIHAANMAKAGGPIRESDNKRLKPEGWQPPDIAGELRRQGWVAGDKGVTEEPDDVRAGAQ